MPNIRRRGLSLDASRKLTVYLQPRFPSRTRTELLVLGATGAREACKPCVVATTPGGIGPSASWQPRLLIEPTA
jgi:hypothetical protein